MNTTELISVNRLGAAGNGGSSFGFVSSTGRYVSFQSYADDLISRDTNSATDVFVRDRVNAVTYRASVDGNGCETDGGGYSQVTGDGRFVSYASSAANVVVPDTNGERDVFLHDFGIGYAWTYCTAKTNSLGCVPALAWSGAPSKSLAAPFFVDAMNIVDNKNGLIFYGFCGHEASFFGGTLCVKSPILRGPIQNSGGTPNTCAGTFSFDFNALIQGGGQPQLDVGADVFAQYWYRDPADPQTVGLTDAVWFRIQP